MSSVFMSATDAKDIALANKAKIDRVVAEVDAIETICKTAIENAVNEGDLIAKTENIFKSDEVQEAALGIVIGELRGLGYNVGFDEEHEDEGPLVVRLIISWEDA